MSSCSPLCLANPSYPLFPSKPPCITPPAPPSRRAPLRPAPSPHLLDLSDDLLLLILNHLLHLPNPFSSSTPPLRPLSSLHPALALAGTCTRLKALLHTALPPLHLDLSPPSSVSSHMQHHTLSRIHHKITHVTMRTTSSPLDNTLLPFLVKLSPPLRKLDLTHARHLTSTTISPLLQNASRTLRALHLRGCIRLTTHFLHTIPTLCNGLEALDLSYLPSVTDKVVVTVTTGLASSLRHLLLAHTAVLGTAGSPEKLSDLQLVTLSLRGTCVSTQAIRKIVAGPVGLTLRTLDVLDCPQLSRTVFDELPGTLWGDANIPREDASTTMCAVTLLRGYVRMVHVEIDDVPAVAVVVLDVASVAPFDRAVDGGKTVELAAFDARCLVVDRAGGGTVSTRARRVLRVRYGLDIMN